MKSCKIIVTGANGFIGSNLTRFFLGNKDDVYIIIRKSSELWRIKDIITELNIKYISTGSKEEFMDIFQEVKPDFLINAIGASQTNNPGNEASTWFGNFSILTNIASALRNFPDTLLIQLGSSFEYGKATLKRNPINEDFKCEPVSDYGISKLFATKYLNYLGNNNMLRSLSIRIFNVYGQYENSNRLVPSIIFKLLDDSEVFLKNPAVYRDFIHMNDISDAIKSVIENEDQFVNGEVLNVGTGKAHSVKEIAEYALKITKSSQNIVTNSVDLRPENSFPGAIADIDKIRSKTGWAPKISIEQGLRISIDWFREHLDLYDSSQS